MITPGLRTKPWGRGSEDHQARTDSVLPPPVGAINSSAARFEGGCVKRLATLSVQTAC